MSENTDKRTATQRIEDLEKVVTMLYQAAQQNQKDMGVLMEVTKDMGLVKEALKILNKKSEAIVQVAAPETGISAESVSAVVVKMNVEELKTQVAGHVANGSLVPVEVSSADSYLVCQEMDANGTVVNPRIQFGLDSQDEATKALLTGKKAGDVVSFGENKLSAMVLEIYSIAKPKAPDAPAEAATEAAPAAEAVQPELAALPAETPVEQFVPSNAGDMVTAS